MTSHPTDWHQALARVSGRLVRGEQWVTTHEQLTVHLGVPVTDGACRRLRRVMRELGWRGPRLMRWGKQTLKGYWRHPTVGLPAIVREEPAAEVATVERETLAPELERVTRLGLQKLDQILRIPTHRGDGNLLRAQTAAAGMAVNAQLRGDEVSPSPDCLAQPSYLSGQTGCRTARRCWYFSRQRTFGDRNQR
jgi:hypothetical protein